MPEVTSSPASRIPFTEDKVKAKDRKRVIILVINLVVIISICVVLVLKVPANKFLPFIGRTPTKIPSLPALEPTASLTPVPNLNKVQMSWINLINTADIRDLVIDGNDLWAAAMGGLIKYDLGKGEILATYSMGDGLIDTNLTSLAMQGNVLWIGCQGGISRFDTITGEWTSYTVSDGLVDGSNLDLRLDGNDLWVSTFNGVSKFDTIQNEWVNYRNEISSWATKWSTFGIQVNSDRIWSTINANAYSRGGVAYFDKAEALWRSFSVTDLYGGDQSRIDLGSVVFSPTKAWVLTRSGDHVLSEFDKQQNTWREVPQLAGNLKSAQLLAYVEPNLIFKKQAKLYQFNPETNAFSELTEYPSSKTSPRFNFLRIVEDDLWFSVSGKVFRFNLTDLEWKDVEINKNAPNYYYNILVAAKDRLLVLTNRGVGWYYPSINSFTSVSEISLERNEFYASQSQKLGMYDSANNRIWVLRPPDCGEYAGCDQPRLWRYDLVTDKVTQIDVSGIEASLLNFMEIVALGNQGQIWLTNYSHLFQYNPQDNTWQTNEAVNHDAALSTDGEIWAVDDDGLNQVLNGKSYLAEGLLGLKRIERGDDGFWIATQNDLYFFKPEDSDVRKYEYPMGPDKNSSFSDEEKPAQIYDLLFKDGVLWLATSRGLARYADDGWNLYTASDGLIGNDILQINTLNGKPWVIVNYGGLSGVYE